MSCQALYSNVNRDTGHVSRGWGRDLELGSDRDLWRLERRWGVFGRNGANTLQPDLSSFFSAWFPSAPPVQSVLSHPSIDHHLITRPHQERGTCSRHQPKPCTSTGSWSMYCILYPAPTVPALRYETCCFDHSHVSHRLSRSETSVHSTLPTILMVVHFVSFFEQWDTHPNHSTLRAVPGWLHQAAAELDDMMHTMLKPL